MIFVPQMFSSRVVRLVLMRLVGVNEDSSPLIKHLLSLTPGALSFSIFLEQLFLPAAGGSWVAIWERLCFKPCYSGGNRGGVCSFRTLACQGLISQRAGNREIEKGVVGS